MIGAPIRHSLKFRLLAGIGLLALVSALILGALTSHLSRQQLERDQGLLLQQTAERMSSRLAQDISTRGDEITFLSGLEQIRDRDTQPATKLALLERIRAAYPFYAWIGITDAAGNITVSTESRLVGANVAEREWFLKGRNGRHFGDVHDAMLLAGFLPKPKWDELPLRLVDISIPILDGSGAFAGVLAAHLSLDWAYEVRQRMLDRLPIEHLDLVVLNRSGGVLMGTPELRSLKADLGGLPAFRAARSNTPQPAVQPWPDGRQYLTAAAMDSRYRGFPGLGWTVVARTPESIAFAPASALATRIMLWTLGCALVFAAVLWWIVGREMRPLEQLGVAARRIREDDLATPIPQPEGGGEVAVFARSLTALVHALQQSRSRFHHLFQEAPVPFCHLGTQGEILALNARFGRTFGYSGADLRHFDDWWQRAFPDADLRARMRTRWEHDVSAPALAGTEVDAGEFLVTCRDGGQKAVRMTGIRVEDGWLVAWFDMSEQRLAEGRLRLWAESFEKAELGLAISDARSNLLVAVNPAFARERGYAREDMTGMSVMSLFPTELAAGMRERMRTLDAGAHGVFESEHVRRDGSRFPVLLDITVLLDETGQPATRVAFSIDISQLRRTERKLLEVQATALEQQREARLATLNQMQDANQARITAESALAALQESEERLQLFIEHAPAALAMFDRDMRYIAVSRRFLDDFRLAAHDVRGLSHYEVFPDLKPEWKALHQRTLGGEALRSDSEAFTRADGSVQWLRWEMHPWHNASGDIGGLVIFSEDITRFRQAEEEVRQLNASLEQRVEQRTAELTAANRELDSFAYAVSHDLRAPLRAVNGFTAALAEDYEAQLPEDAKALLGHIQVASRRMNELIDGILTLSHSGRGEVQRDIIDLTAAATRALGALARAEPDRSVAWTVAPGLAATGDHRMIESVLENLLANAWKYTARTPRAEIRVYAEERDGQRWFCVADNGAGFSMAQAERLFKPFSRLHRNDEFPGLGIGLATVQRIIRRHGGEIVAHGEPAHGAVFSFTLPALAGANAESDPAALAAD